MTYSTVIMITTMIQVLHLLIYGKTHPPSVKTYPLTHTFRPGKTRSLPGMLVSGVNLIKEVLCLISFRQIIPHKIWTTELWAVNPAAQIKACFFFSAACLHVLNSGLALIIFKLNHMLNGFEPFVCTRLPVDDHSTLVLYCIIYWAGAMKIHNVRFA